MEILIIGGGPAGLQAAIHCRQFWPDKSVTLIEAEEKVGYCRPLLPQFMAGQLREENLFFWPLPDDPLLQVLTGLKVQFLDRANQSLHLENQEKISYQRLILTPGGRAIMPPCEGIDYLRGIFPVRSLAEARKARDWLSRSQKIMVLGGGLVGVKTAVSLRTAGLQVTLVEKEDHLLPQALTTPAARLVESHLRKMGIDLFLGQTLEEIEGEEGELKSVKLTGTNFPCQTLLIAVGSIPNVAFLEGSGLLEDGELLVSPAMQTRDPKIFAAGDAVAISTPGGEKLTLWTWPQAVCQGNLAAANVYRLVPGTRNFFTRPNAMNLHGLSIVILGAPRSGAERISYQSPGEGVYREVFLLDGKIVGGALLGDISGAGILHAYMIDGKVIDKNLGNTIRPRTRAFFQFFRDPLGKRPRTARFLFPWENEA